MATRNRRSSDATVLSDVQSLKTRIVSLEKEVAEYKKRLDELRKAKNQTILKHEKQYLEVSNPINERNQQYEKTIKTLEEKISTERAEHVKELQALDESHRKELSDLNEKHEEKMSDLSSKCDSLQETSKEANCSGHIEEISRLKLENNGLKEEIENLLLHMSIKEAAWCEKEEITKKRLEIVWQAKYAEWMKEMERKISELQETNNLLRVLLEKHRPANNP